MRKVSAITCTEDNEIVVVDEAGQLWHGTIGKLKDDRDRVTDERVINWQPLLGPPDGVHITERKKSFWDRMEKKLREAAERFPDISGETVSLAQAGEIDAGATGESLQDSPDDSLQDGEGQDTRQ